MSTPILRYRVSWTGFSGAPGVSTFYLNAAASYPDPAIATHQFFNAIKTYLPGSVQLNFPNTTDTLDAETGKLLTSGTSAGAAAVSGTAGGTYEAAGGMVVKWVTADIVDGHRVHGRTFLVPCSNAGSGGGNPSSAQVSDINTAAGIMASTLGSAFIVWARPFVDPKGVKPSRAGSIHVVTGTNVPNEFVILRSRRD